MRIHHFDCGGLRPLGGAFMDGSSPGLVAHLGVHCLALETERDGIVLVDTGLGVEDLTHPYHRLASAMVLLMRPPRNPALSMRERLRRRGLNPDDVRHVVMTHLDFDHAGGLSDFPRATVHVSAVEAAAARRRAGPSGRARWRPQQWGDTGRFHLYPMSGEGWMGFGAVRALAGLPEEILLIPLPGHTPGHCGVAVKGSDGWLLHAGDAYFHRHQVQREYGPPSCPPGLRAFQKAMMTNPGAGARNEARVRALARDPDAQVTVFCTHDVVEYAALAAQSEGRRARLAAA